ncbi:MAG TPA: ABC transporter permease [Anaerolineales bacterium]|nr:ABC transporter permease [Anaerolineales bacterium]HNA89762.1 ABC transporter permease [Anaerolineales bacterium]
MWSYLVRRLIQAIFTLFIITMLCFILTRLSSDPMAQYANRPGITAEDKARIAKNLGLDQPMPVQYVRWLGLALQGDLGDSFFSKQPVIEMIKQRMPMTLTMMITAEIFIILVSLILGLVAAVKQYSFVDNVITTLSFIGFSMPIFFIALGCIMLFAVKFKQWGLPYLPTGADIWDPKDPVEMIRHLIMPVFCLVAIQTAGYSRFLRTSILEVLGLDYVRTARAKGLTEKVTLYKHAFRNAVLPFVTIIGLDIPGLMGGALVTESVFTWPGMGRLFWEYAGRGDYPVVLGVLLLTSSGVVFFTIIVDVLYTVIDPRIRLS